MPTGLSAIDEKGKRILDASYCNVFARDVTSAMHAELPAGDSANEMCGWLNSKDGKRAGWHLATGGPEQAQAMANKGCPAIAIVQGDKHGHVMVLRPGQRPRCVGSARRKNQSARGGIHPSGE